MANGRSQPRRVCPVHAPHLHEPPATGLPDRKPAPTLSGMDTTEAWDKLWRRRGGMSWTVHQGIDGSESAAGLAIASSTSYDFDGLKRPCDRARPHATIQLTAHGSGCFRGIDGREHVVGPGRLFMAIIPSAHRYWFPGGEYWRFLWSWFRHSYVTAAITRAIELTGSCPELPADPALVDALVAHQLLFTARRQPDPWAVESAVLAVAVAIRRFADAATAGGERAVLLRTAQDLVAEQPSRAPTVADLARREGCTATALAQRFRANAGLTPSRALLDARLELVRHDLLADARPLHAIAQANGFAAANHLCRVFRTRFGLTPARYRALVGRPES